MAVINESDMSFGKYEDEDVFYIEKCDQYKTDLMPNGVKSCEFILKRDNTLYFIEAKKSCPNKPNSGSAKEKREKYNKYIADITDKMRHSLAFYANILMKRHSNEGISENLLEADLSEKQIKVVLVVKNAEKSWLYPLQDKLRKELKPESKIWKFDLFVINESDARKKHFVI